MGRLLFISHLHDEKEMAKLFQDAIEADFGGFIDVFVSSNKRDIMVGDKFLEHIEKHLLDCIGAIYLISPKSVDRSWINFELGAIWIRNLLEKRLGNSGIPALPICHSGSDKSKLPVPLANLNAIQGNKADELEYAFKSIQKAFGGKGNLSTNFEELAQNVKKIEDKYMVGEYLARVLTLAGFPQSEVTGLATYCRNFGSDKECVIPVEYVDNLSITEIKSIEKGPLKKYIEFKITGDTGTFGFNDGTQFIGTNKAELIVSTNLVIEHESLLKERMK